MGRRVKQLVRKRSKVHRDRVKKGHRTRLRARARGFRPATKKRKARAKRRMNKR